MKSAPAAPKTHLVEFVGDEVEARECEQSESVEDGALSEHRDALLRAKCNSSSRSVELCRRGCRVDRCAACSTAFTFAAFMRTAAVRMSAACGALRARGEKERETHGDALLEPKEDQVVALVRSRQVLRVRVAHFVEYLHQVIEAI